MLIGDALSGAAPKLLAMRWRRIKVTTVIKQVVLAAAAVQGATLLTLMAIDQRRKRHRVPAVFPRLPPRSVTAGGSEVTVYTYGEDLYYDMLGAIRQAKDEIYFETFIWKSDAIGQSFKRALIEAADRGVQVYVAYDAFANLVVPRAFFDLPPTITVRRHPVVASGFRFIRNSGRDHRKILVVDHDAAFVGGYNSGPRSATDWRDTHARLTGDIVWDMRKHSPGRRWCPSTTILSAWPSCPTAILSPTTTAPIAMNKASRSPTSRRPSAKHSPVRNWISSAASCSCMASPRIPNCRTAPSRWATCPRM